MSEGIIAVKNTAAKYLKGAADQTIRGYFWLSYLQSQGRIVIGDTGGVSQTWNVMARQPDVRQSGDDAQIVFAEHDAYEQLTVDIRGYHVTDRLTEKKRLMNASPLQIIDLYGTKMENLVKAITDQFGQELYVDGYASGNENRLCGIESFCGSSTTVAADLVAKPSDTYAGKSTALGTLGGSWSTNLSTKPNASVATDWPEGQGASEYDYLAPKLVNYSSSNWGTGGTTWADNATKVMRRSRLWCHHTSGMENAPMLHLLSPNLYGDFLDSFESKNRAVLPHPTGIDLGFPDAVNFEGAIVKQDYGCPAGVGYGINANEMLLFNIHDDGSFFRANGPEEDFKTNSYLFFVYFYGNMRFNPKAFAKYAAYA